MGEWAIRPVLEHYEIVFKDRSGEQTIRCPTGEHDDRKPSCSLNISRGLWYCHSCGRGGSAIDLIKERENIDVASALREYEKNFGEKSGSIQKPDESVWDGIFQVSGDKSRGRRKIPPRAGRDPAPW